MMHNPNWIEKFKTMRGHPPRILHIGNIANNAYQTAKMLNAAGADCDVLCADYYHTMGTPEWDDADFTGDVGNQDFPAWHQVDLGDFVRPPWFAQGPRHLAIAYLMAKRSGEERKSAKLWRKMEHERRHLAVRESSSLRGIVTRWDSFKISLRDSAQFMAARRKKNFGSGWTPQKAADIMARLNIDAKLLFPDRTMHFGPLTEYYIRMSFVYRDLMRRYDVVQAYAFDPIWPYLAGIKNYVAWEHGTLRDMPYEDNERGYLTLLAYARAKAVYVTNVDCYDSAVYITQKSGTPIVCGLHGFDTQRMLQKQQMAGHTAFDRTQFAKPQEQLFFCPARADIDAHYGTFLKKNDMLYRALYRLWKEKGGGFRVLQLEWGHDTEALKNTIQALDPAFADTVVWRPPFQKAEYYQILQQSQLVFDNFLLPLMGGNGIETLMSGHAALVNKRIPEELMLRFFPEMWPIFPIDNENDIYQAAKTALENPAACLALAREAQQWILKYHSHDAIVQRNLQAYQWVHPMP